MKILCIGAGTIGLSWARLFASNGHEVAVTDPRPDLEQAITALGLEPEVAARIHPVERAEGLKDADIVQEAGPESLAFKKQLVADFGATAPAHALLFSSSSALTSTAFAGDAPDDVAARVAIGHPFNPPHVMPLVEVVPGERTAPETVQAGVDFYRSLGKEPIPLGKEVPGHVGNRLQKALMNEAMGLVVDGVITVPDLDKLMKASLGLRWAAVGPIEGMALGGGSHGVRGLINLLSESFGAIELHNPAWNDETLHTVYEQADAAYGRPARPELARRRDEIQLGILELRQRVDAEQR